MERKLITVGVILVIIGAFMLLVGGNQPTQDQQESTQSPQNTLTVTGNKGMQRTIDGRQLQGEE